MSQFRALMNGFSYRISFPTSPINLGIFYMLEKNAFFHSLQHTGSGPYLKTPGSGSVIYCIISDSKPGNPEVCPQSQQWEQLEGLHVAELHHGSTSFSPKTLPTTSDLTPGHAFPKENLPCWRGFLLCEEGSGGIQEEAGTTKSHSAAAEAKPSAGCCPFASHVLSFCCANKAVGQPRELSWKSLHHLMFSGGPAHGLAPCATTYVSTNLDTPKRMGSLWMGQRHWLTDLSARRAVTATYVKKIQPREQ